MKASARPSAAMKRAPSPRLDLADLGDRDVGSPGGGAEASGFGRRHGADDLVVVAAGKHGFDRVRVRQRSRPWPHRRAARAQHRYRPRRRTRGTACRNRRPGRPRYPSPPRHGCARPRPAHCAAAAADSAKARCWRCGSSSFQSLAVAHHQAERGIADRAAHEHAVARLWRRRAAPSCLPERCRTWRWKP